MLYGISLNADGTTKVVAQRLDAEDASAAQREPHREAPAVPATEELASPPVG
jgi:hypothetical protein